MLVLRVPGTPESDLKSSKKVTLKQTSGKYLYFYGSNPLITKKWTPMLPKWLQTGTPNPLKIDQKLTLVPKGRPQGVPRYPQLPKWSQRASI